MNIHPFVVHFPIALLAVYTMLETVRLPLLQRQPWLFPIKAVLLVIGMIGGILALQSGELAEHAWAATDARPLIEMHSLFAAASMWIYGILAALYCVEWVRRERPSATDKVSPLLRTLWAAAVAVEQRLYVAPIVIIGSVAGFLALGITGALGGAIVYGPHADPVVSLVYKLLIAQ